MKAILVVSLLAVAGCANSVRWVKDGATEQDFNRDSYGCERDVRQSGYYGTGVAGALNAQSFYARCMEANGYRRMRVDDASESPVASTNPAQNSRDIEMRFQASQACEQPTIQAKYPSYGACFFDHYKR